MTTTTTTDIANQIRVTNIIYYSLITGILLFFAVVMVIIQNKVALTDTAPDKIFTVIVPIFGLLMMFLSRMVYNQMISKRDNKSSLLQKISFYRTAKIISWAMIEGACFFSLIAIMLTANYLYIAVFIFLFGFFFLMKPSKESLIRDMRLNSEEVDLILKS